MAIWKTARPDRKEGHCSKHTGPLESLVRRFFMSIRKSRLLCLAKKATVFILLRVSNTDCHYYEATGKTLSARAAWEYSPLSLQSVQSKRFQPHSFNPEDRQKQQVCCGSLVPDPELLIHSSWRVERLFLNISRDQVCHVRPFIWDNWVMMRICSRPSRRSRALR